MAPSLGVNLRVTGHCNQGGRKYMEDVFSVAYQQTEDEKDLEYAYFGIFDGHGGREAALYAKTHLMDAITSNRNFWSDDDQMVLKAIREGFLTTQQNMWKALPTWKKTNQGHPSTAGTTASVCFIKRGKLFIGHVGDSGIVLGERDPHHPSRWRAKSLTKDHKPDCNVELARIRAAGGKVVEKAGVPRVVWYRPHDPSHQGPVRRSTPIDEIPFLAVARALGDLWSYNAKDDVFVVSPDPDLHVYDVNVLKDRCLVLATDGAWNVLTPDMAVQCVSESEKTNEKHMIDPQGDYKWVNPSKRLVDYAIDRWKLLQLRADNTSIVTVMLDPPGPPRAQVLRRMYGVTGASVAAAASAATRSSPTPSEQPAPPPQPLDGVDGAKANIAIISRFPNSDQTEEKTGKDLFRDAVEGRPSPVGGGRVMNSSVVGGGSGDPSRRFIQGFDGLHRVSDNQKVDHVKFKRTPPTPPSQQRFPVIPSDNETGPVPLAARRNGSVASLDPPSPDELPRRQQTVMKKAGVQVSEVSSSNTPPPLPQRNLRNPPASLRKGLADLQSNATSVGAIISGFEARRTRQNSGPSSQQQGSRENKKAAAAAAAAKTAVTPKAAHTPKVTTPRVLRPRNTPTPSSNVKLLAVSPGHDDDEDEGQNGGGMKRKRGSIESAVASKMLRSGSKTAGKAAADRQTPIGIARKNAGATPARLGRK